MGDDPSRQKCAHRNANYFPRCQRPTGKQFTATVVEVNDEGHRRLQFSGTPDIGRELEWLGEIPLPPYIHRDDKLAEDKERYQTVFAKTDGSVAAPTAGLHFTPELLEQIRARGVKICFVTLHVGLGTFLPVKSETLAAHKMHEERFEIGEETVHAVNEAKKSGNRVIAVGTTSVRVLESVAAQNDGKLNVHAGKTNIFIFPPFQFQIVDALLTNFHLALLHFADAGERVCRAGRNARTRNGFVRLRRGDPRTLPFFQLRRCDADFMNPKSKVQNPKLPFVLVNMAMTADGKIATANRAVHSFGSARDLEHLYELRATADAVMCGARTIEISRGILGTGGAKFREAAAKKWTGRISTCASIVSGSGSINPRAEIFKKHFSPVIILTTARISKADLKKLRAVADEVKICGKKEINFRAALRWLRAKWKVKRLLCEGGGELNDALFLAGLVDELHLTICPKIFGGRAAPTIADGLGFARLAGTARFKSGIHAPRRRRIISGSCAAPEGGLFTRVSTVAGHPHY